MYITEMSEKEEIPIIPFLKVVKIETEQGDNLYKNIEDVKNLKELNFHYKLASKGSANNYLLTFLIETENETGNY